MTRILWYVHNHILRQRARKQNHVQCIIITVNYMLSQCLQDGNLFSCYLLHLSFTSNQPFVRVKSLINVLGEMNPDQRVRMPLPRPLQEAPTEGGRCQCYNRWWVQLPVWAGAADETTNRIFSSPHKEFCFHLSCMRTGIIFWACHHCGTKAASISSLVPHFHIYIKLCSHGTEIDIFTFYKNTAAKWQKCHN